jgi:TonB family protein
MNFLIDFGIKSAIAMGITFLAAFVLRRGSASVRYALWTCGLLAVLMLPLVSRITPRLNFERRAAAVAARTETAPGVAIVVQASRPSPASSFPIAMTIWMGGVLLMLARVGAGHWRVRSLFGKAETIRDSRWLALAGDAGRQVVLKRSMATDVPLSYGIFRATVLLPGEAEHWSEERRRIVLAHELIHARRLDSLWGLLAQLALAVNWFNPLAWLAAKEFRKEQERSCDDAVVMAGTSRTVYAAHLVDLVRSIAIPEPALGMAQEFDLEGSVRALLDEGRARRTMTRKLCAAMFAATVALTVPLAAIHAQAPTTGSVAGVVYDPSGAVVQGASITLKNTAGSNEEVGVTSENGRYTIQNIPAGDYLVKVVKPGFAMYQKTLTLQAGAPATADLHLTVGEVSERVEVVGERPQSATAASSTRQRIRVGGMVQAVNLISKVNPAYPADARAEGVEGTVLLRAVIAKDGSLLHVTSLSNGVDPRLVSAARAAVPLWRYEPAHLNGEPIEVVTTIAVTFRLN